MTNDTPQPQSARLTMLVDKVASAFQAGWHSVVMRFPAKFVQDIEGMACVANVSEVSDNLWQINFRRKKST